MRMDAGCYDKDVIPLGPIVWILLGLSAAATGLAWLIAARRSSYRAVAWALTFFLASDLIRLALQPGAPGPYAGWDRVAFHIRSALFVGWRFAIAALSVAVFTRRKPWPLAIPFLLVAGALVAGYPTIRGPLLQQVFLGVELTCLCVSLGCLILWLRGPEPRGLQHFIAGTIVVSELTLVVGPYAASIYLNWDRAWAVLLVEYLALLVFQGAGWSRLRQQKIS